MLIIKIVVIILLLLLIGDFIATFLYHVPEHVFGKYHLIVHHSNNRSFIRYAIAKKRPQALISVIALAFIVRRLSTAVSPKGLTTNFLLFNFNYL